MYVLCSRVSFQGEAWNDSQIAQDMERLLAVRDTVMSLLEQARIDKYVNPPTLDIRLIFLLG